MFKKRFAKDVKYFGLRDPFLLEICKDKSVLHVGCTDWPFVEKAFNDGSLLHSQLKTVTRSLIGVDIDREGIEYMQSLIPGKYISGNLKDVEIQSEILALSFDVILVPDVIEHVPNQNDFISGLMALSKKSGSEVIITTPNVYSLKSFLAAFLGLDFTHTDHRLFHNESTLTTAFCTDFNIEKSDLSFGYSSRDINARYGFALSFISRAIDIFFYAKPYLADTIILRLKPNMKRSSH